MPIYDVRCPNCGRETYDVLAKVGEYPPCPDCNTQMEHLWHSAPAVIPDDIPGGFVIEHMPGLVGHKVYSKSELRHVTAAAGYVNVVEHVPENKGTDKARHDGKGGRFTTRWY